MKPIGLLLALSLVSFVYSGGDQEEMFCSRRYDFFDKPTYIKSGCFVGFTATWPHALAVCEAHGMFLYQFQFTADHLAVLSAAGEMYGNATRKAIWVNARKNQTGQWNAYEGDFMTNIIGYKRFYWIDTAAQSAGDCLSIDNKNGMFRVSGHACNDTLSFICSFKKL